MSVTGNMRLRGTGPGAITMVALLVGTIIVGTLLLVRGPGDEETASPGPTFASPTATLSGESATPLDSTAPSASVGTSMIPSPAADRRGVPAAIYDRYWSVSWGVVGSVGTTASQTLPEGERLLGVADGFIASSIWLGEGRSPTRILIRAFGGPEPMRTVETDTWVRQGTIVNGVLFWAGPQAADFGAPPLDGGIWAMDLRSNEPPIAVVPPGDDLTPLIGGTTAERLQFQVSPSGRTLASTIGGGGGYRTDVVSTASLSPRAVLEESVIGLTDDVAIVRRGVPVTTGPVRVGAVEIDSSKLLWTYPIEGYETSIATFRPPFVFDQEVAFTIHARVEGADRQLLLSFDTRSGERRKLMSQGADEAWLYLVPGLSTGDQLALAIASFEDALSDADHIDISMFDLDERSLDKDVFRIELP